MSKALKKEKHKRTEVLIKNLVEICLIAHARGNFIEFIEEFQRHFRNQCKQAAV